MAPLGRSVTLGLCEMTLAGGAVAESEEGDHLVQVTAAGNFVDFLSFEL